MIEAVGAFLPNVAQPWIVAFARAPGLFAIGVVVLVLLLTRSSSLQVTIRDDMRALWEVSLGLHRSTAGIRSTADWVRTLRQDRRYQRGFQALKWTILPNTFGPAMLALAFVLMLVVVGVSVLRSSIWIAESSRVWCRDAQRSSFLTAMPCWPQTVEANKRYRVHLAVDPRLAWRDLEIDASPQGFEASRMSLIGNLFTPLRRSLSGRWFQPMVKIVPNKGLFVIVPLEMQRADTAEPRYTAQFTAPKTGQIYVFVNDVLLPPWLPRPTYFYENNKGAATEITTEPIHE